MKLTNNEMAVFGCIKRFPGQNSREIASHFKSSFDCIMSILSGLVKKQVLRPCPTNRNRRFYVSEHYDFPDAVYKQHVQKAERAYMTKSGIHQTSTGLVHYCGNQINGDRGRGQGVAISGYGYSSSERVA